MHKGKKVDLYKMFGETIYISFSSIACFKRLKYIFKIFITEKLLEPPTHESISNSIKRLQDVGAFDWTCMLTPLGHHLATLPVNSKIGKLILFGAIFCCLDSALTIAACLSYKNPFYVPFERRREVDPKQEFFVVNSDQLTVLKAYKVFLQLQNNF